MYTRRSYIRDCCIRPLERAAWKITEAQREWDSTKKVCDSYNETISRMVPWDVFAWRVGGREVTVNNGDEGKANPINLNSTSRIPSIGVRLGRIFAGLIERRWRMSGGSCILFAYPVCAAHLH
jgi:hypothetical protein